MLGIKGSQACCMKVRSILIHVKPVQLFPTGYQKLDVKMGILWYSIWNLLIHCHLYSRFIREFTKGVEGSWTINKLNHFIPSEFKMRMRRWPFLFKHSVMWCVLEIHKIWIKCWCDCNWKSWFKIKQQLWAGHRETRSYFPSKLQNCWQ